MVETYPWAVKTLFSSTTNDTVLGGCKISWKLPFGNAIVGLLLLPVGAFRLRTAHLFFRRRWGIMRRHKGRLALDWRSAHRCGVSGRFPSCHCGKRRVCLEKFLGCLTTKKL